MRSEAYDKRSVCRGCQRTIEWGELFGKRHPFNLDGTSHFESCPNADAFRKGRRGVSIFTLANLDVFYRQRWRSKYLGDGKGFDRSRLTECRLERDVARRVAEALYYVGGPLHFDNWQPLEIMQYL